MQNISWRSHLGSNLTPALFAAGLTLFLGATVMGLRLKTEGITLTLEVAHPNTFINITLAALAVFLFQLFRQPIRELQSQTAARLKLPQINVTSGKQRLGLMLIIGGLLIFPFFSGRASIDLATLVLIYIMLAVGLNIVVGLAGLLDLGYVGFYAVGAYTYGLLYSYLGFTFWYALPLAGLAAAIAGWLLGYPVLRLRGDYLAIVTLGFGEIIRLMLNNLTEVTGGPNGISGIPKPTFFGLEFARRGENTFHEFFNIAFSPVHRVMYIYFLALILVIISIYIINRLMRMPIGRAWEALREDEIACRSLGLSPTNIKLSAFTLGASFAGFAGAFFAARQSFINPESFAFIESAIILSIVVLGGMGSQLGVVIAAIAMVLLPELAREFNEYRMLLFGLMMVLMMVWRPQGLIPAKRPHRELNLATASDETRGDKKDA